MTQTCPINTDRPTGRWPETFRGRLVYRQAAASTPVMRYLARVGQDAAMNFHGRRPRWRRLRRQPRYKLRPDLVPQVGVELYPEIVERFDGFNAMRRKLAPDARLPIEAEVLLVLEGPGTVTAWTMPTARVEAIRACRLTGAAVAAYEAVLAGLGREQAPIAWLTANEIAPGQYQASIEGHPL